LFGFFFQGSCQSSTAPIEILNTRLVTTPKNLADKKSEFLKALREEKTSNTKNIDLNESNCGKSNEKCKGTAMPKQVSEFDLKKIRLLL